jgi:hypothetical protein
VSGGPQFRHPPFMSDHDLIDSYVYADALIGHGPEPWLTGLLARRVTATEAELRHRKLLREAKRMEQLMWDDHHVRKTQAAERRRRQRQRPSSGIPGQPPAENDRPL